MPHSAFKSTIDVAASRLRAMVRSTTPDTFLGSEEALIEQLGVSRPTVRQVARLLEREGLLRVRRGINGGYFAARPNVQTIESTVSTYLEMLETDVKDTTVVGSILWVEAVNKAAQINTEQARTLALSLRQTVRALQADATFADVLRVEQEIRNAVFKLIDSRYVELIFQLSAAFAERQFPVIPSAQNNTAEHREFIQAWRNAKLMELDAIADGDAALGVMAAHRSRNLWHRRLWDEE